MLKAGDLLDLGPLGAKFLITKTAVDTAGQSFEMEWELAPRTGGTPVHIHPHAAETYKVIEGQLDIYVDGKWDTLSAGEERTVPERVAHTFRNAGDEIARVYNTHEPALRFDEYFEGLHRMVAHGIVSQRGMTPKALLHLALLMSSGYEPQKLDWPCCGVDVPATWCGIASTHGRFSWDERHEGRTRLS